VIRHSISKKTQMVTKSGLEEYDSLISDFGIYEDAEEFDMELLNRKVNNVMLDEEEDKENEIPNMNFDAEEVDLDTSKENTQQEDWN
jgi:hypothetical protein